MGEHLIISTSDIVDNLKLACKFSSVLEAIATQKIIAEVAEEAGIKVEEAELQKESEKLRLEHKLVKAKDTWDWLKKHHLSLNDFEALVHKKVLSQKLANHLFSTQVERFFYEHKLEYIAAVTYEIVFDDRDLALELFYALEEGEITFQEIARLYIQEPELRRAGGYQGLRHRKDFRPEIAAAVFAASAPEILRPISTQKGIYLIWIEEIIQPKLDEELRQKIITELFFGWLKQQIEGTKIVTQLDSDVNLKLKNELLKQA